MSRALWVLGWLNAFPLTLAGWLLFLVFGEHDYTHSAGVRVFEHGPWFRKHFFERFRVAAFMWGATLHIPGPAPLQPSRPLHPGLVAHELVHFKQARIFGVFLPLAYGIAALVALAKGGHPYRDNWFERMARSESGH